ncbi:MAG: spondin domain-containing protein [Planctomycetota bacterium]
MRAILPAAAAAVALSSYAHAQTLPVEVTVENLAPANDISFAPLRIVFGNGTFDAFNIDETAGAGIVSVAEGGVGDVWFDEAATAEPASTRGTVVPSTGPGPLFPGATGSNVFTVDTDLNQFFTFANMVIPSNDLFLGNDNPTAFQLFDDDGNLLITEITQTASQIWDANSEVADPAAAAFLVGGNNDLRTPENGTVAFDFSELSVFDGLPTPAYTFDTNLAGDTPIFRISFAVVPEPTSAAALGLAGLTMLRRRR